MSRYRFLLAFFGLFFPTIIAAQWHRANPDWSCVAASGQRVIVAGSHGSMLISPDAGVRFYRAHLPQPDSIIDVALLNPATGFAITSSQNVLQSEDSGKTWKSLSVAFKNPVRLCVVGNSIYLIEEGGRCFRRNSAGEWAFQGTAPAQKVSSLSFASEQVGVLIGHDSLLFRTSDAGVTWSQVVVGNNAPVGTACIYQDIGVLFCKDDRIFASNNQGATWDSVATKDFSTLHPKGVLAVDDIHYLVYGGCGSSRLLGFSSDAGRSWKYSTPILSNDQMQFLDAAVTSGGTVILVGKFGTILRSENGGETWQVRANAVLTTNNVATNNGQSPFIADISFATDSIAVAVISGATDNTSWLRTTDAGTTWLYQRQTLGGYSTQINAIHFFDQEHGVVSASNPANIFRTADTGKNWYQATVKQSPKIRAVKQIRYINRSSAWLIADTALFFSADSGATWRGKPLPTGWMPERLHVVDDAFVLATARSGNNERLYRTRDTGTTWEVILERPELPQHHQFGDVHFLNHQLGFLSLLDTLLLEPPQNTRSRIIRTTDGGATWDTVGDSFSEDIEMITPTHGYAVGRQILLTNDAGLTWSNDLLSGQDFGVAELQKIIASPNQRTLLVIGSGVILRKEADIQTSDTPTIPPPLPIELDLSMMRTGANN
jgi:photosystem II stability/assembly factor-like uncharacterized protein